uniref:Uncharacterized protein n=1 Tax=Arundo donax TaxID=35708 RepID=A0A0A9B4W8_ARUDO
MAQGAADAPLLASCTESARRRRNLYPFACATLASMTTALMGYSSSSYSTISSTMQPCFDRSVCGGIMLCARRSRGDERRGALHSGGPGPLRRRGRGARGVHERVHARIYPRRRMGGRPAGPSWHARARQRVPHGRRARHVTRWQLRRAHVRTVRHRRRRWVLPRRRAGVQRRDFAGVHARRPVVPA